MCNQFLGDEFLLVFETFVSYQTTLKDKLSETFRRMHVCIFLARKELMPVNAHPVTIVLQLCTVFTFVTGGTVYCITFIDCLFLNNDNINNYFNNSKEKSKPLFSN